MSTPLTQLSENLVELLDGISDPMSIATAIRDREGRILDFRIEFVNEAAGRWAGVPRQSLIGLITGEILSELRSSGLFDRLCEVVDTGQPYSEEGASVADAVTGGAWVGGSYDFLAIRLGDGYVSTWRLRQSSPPPA